MSSTSPFVTPVLTVNATYYVACESSGPPACVSPRTQVAVTVLVPSPTSQTVCRSNQMVVSAGIVGTRYEWYKNGQSAPFKLTEIASIQRGTNTASLTLVSTQTSGTYYCKVFAANGSFVWAGPFVVNIDYSCTSPGAREAASEPLLTVETQVAPNPIAGGWLRAVVRGAGGQPLSIELTDVQGRLLKQQSWPVAETTHTVEWNVSQHPAGIYLLHVQTPQGFQNVKVLKTE